MDNEFALELAERGLDQDAINAYRYVAGRLEGKTMKAIAEEFRVSRQTLYEWVRRWDGIGLLDRARQELLLGEVENIREAVSEVLRDWPLVLSEVKRIALHARSEHVRLEAAAWLHGHVVQPALLERPKDASRELAYTSSDQAFDPTSIPDATVSLVVETPLPKVIAPKH